MINIYLFGARGKNYLSMTPREKNVLYLEQIYFLNFVKKEVRASAVILKPKKEFQKNSTNDVKKSRMISKYLTRYHFNNKKNSK